LLNASLKFLHYHLSTVRWRLLMLLAGVLWLWVVFVLLIVIDAYGRIDHTHSADVIIVLGAGLTPDNLPGPALTRRTAHAANLWRSHYAPMIICSGGKPGNRPRSEADACAERLRENGVPDAAIIQEDRSRSTEENAIQCHVIMRANGWQTAIVISDNFHLFRAYRLFSHEGIVTYTSPATELPDPLTYVVYMLREVVAFHWQLMKEVFNLSVTYVQSI
jgi:uncharacterized SAM-binding protein YcdF (DUF218 family)